MELLLDDVWPRKHGMNEHGCGALSDGAVVAFRDAILMMSIHATEFDALFLLDTALMKIFGSKDSIVSVVAFD
jgi:hypothetical protein